MCAYCWSGRAVAEPAGRRVKKKLPPSGAHDKAANCARSMVSGRMMRVAVSITCSVLFSEPPIEMP